jgi:hypothetical protein
MSSEEINYDELVSKPTVRADLPSSVSGNFQSEEEAQILLQPVLGFTRVIGSVFDLTALDGITIADAYGAALASLDRG